LRGCGQVQTASGQPLDFLVERDDGEEVVLIAHWHIRNDEGTEEGQSRRRGGPEEEGSIMIY
jgi:hypothetical protein